MIKIKLYIKRVKNIEKMNFTTFNNYPHQRDYTDSDTFVSSFLEPYTNLEAVNTSISASGSSEHVGGNPDITIGEIILVRSITSFPEISSASQVTCTVSTASPL